MVKMTLGVEGMSCGMCEAHINDAIRNSFKVKKVTSSQKDAQTIIIAQDEISQADLEKVIGATGYVLKSVECEPYEKKGFHLFGK